MKLGFGVSMRGVLTAGMALVAIACGEERAPAAPRAPRDAGLPGGRHPDAGVAFGSCVSGQTRDCSVVIGVHNGVISCFYGTQVCIDGTWGPCGDGTVEMFEDVPGAVGNGSVPAAPTDAGVPPQ